MSDRRPGWVRGLCLCLIVVWGFFWLVFGVGFFFLFEEGWRINPEFPAKMLFRSVFESVLNRRLQKLRYKATF